MQSRDETTQLALQLAHANEEGGRLQELLQTAHAELRSLQKVGMHNWRWSCSAGCLACYGLHRCTFLMSLCRPKSLI